MLVPNFLDIIDILLVAFLLYGTYKLMKNSGAITLFVGILSFLALWFLVSYVFKLKLFGGILDKVVSVGAIALIVLFQNEIRRFLVMLGSRKQWTNFVKLFSPGYGGESPSQAYMIQIVLACKNMSEKKTGALIVLEEKENLGEYIHTGERIHGVVSASLLENIFFKNSPLHDGAVIVSEGKIEAAACILPVSGSINIPKSYGLRHRSALGISELTDATAIVVSEETGQIAVAKNGKIQGNVKDLDRLLIKTAGTTKTKWHNRQKIFRKRTTI